MDIVLDAIFLPLLKLGYGWALFILTLIVTVIITIIYKYATDQETLGRIKERQKVLQKKVQKYSKDPKKAMELNKEMFSLNGQYMKHSMSSMLYTFIPILILFGWISVHLSVYPLEIGEEFNLTADLKNEIAFVELNTNENFELLSDSLIENPSGEVTWRLKALNKGVYTVILKTGTENITKEIVVSENNVSIVKDKMNRGGIISFIYSSSERKLDSKSVFERVSVSYKTIKPFGNFSFFGWKPGWLGAYILMSILISTGLRKILKIY